jgi:hypothetical protein
MGRVLRALAIAMLLVVMSAVGASAGSFHFKTSSFTLGSLTFNGIAVGLGNAGYTVELTGTATVRANCVNPGGSQAPGRNDLFTAVTNTTSLTTGSNGQATVNLTVHDPTLADFGSAPPSKKEAGCPNGNWTVANITVIGWTAAHLTVVEAATGRSVLDQRYTCGTSGGSFSCTPA